MSNTRKSFALSVVGSILALSVQLTVYAQGGFDGPGRYEIVNLQSSKVIDLDRNDQSTVIQFSSRNTDNQAWDLQPAGSGYFYIRNGMNGYALEASSDRNSAPLRGVPFTGSPAQQWRIDPGKDGNPIIVNRNGKVIDVPDGTGRDGARLQTYGLTGDANQRFTFRRLSGRMTRRDYPDRPGARDAYDRGRQDQGRFYDERDRMFKFNGDGVCLYRDRDYRGEAYCVRAGEDARDVGPNWRDSFLSAKFFGRTRVVDLYGNGDFRGERITIRNDEPDLSRLRRGRGNQSNLRVSSLRAN